MKLRVISGNKFWDKTVHSYTNSEIMDLFLYKILYFSAEKSTKK